jgi:addiction module HigA family antidote
MRERFKDMKARINPMPHPGEILMAEFLEPMGLTIYALSKATHVPRSRIHHICKGEHNITPSIAARLGKFFDVDPKWFLNMQTAYDAEQVEDLLSTDLALIEPYDPAKHRARGVRALV